MFTLNTLTLFWNFSKLPTFVPPLFTIVTPGVFTFCSSFAKLSQTPRVCKLLSCCLSPFWGEILNICHFVTIGHHWSPLVTIGHLRLSYTPLTKLQKTCIIVLNTTNASEAGMSWKVRIYLSKHKEDWLYLIDVKTFKPKVFDNWTDAQEAANLWSNSDIELNRSSKEVSNAT